MKNVNLVFFRGKGFLSALIRWQTRGKYSHVGVLFEDMAFFEAWTGSGKHLWSNGGVAKLPNWKIPDDVHLVTFYAEDDQYEKMRAHAEKSVGCKYDYRSVLRFLTRIKPASNDKLFCSEAALEIFEAGDFKLLNAPASVVSPAVLWMSPFMR